MKFLVIAVIFLHIFAADIIVGIRVDVSSDSDEAKISARLFFVPIYSKIFVLSELLTRVADVKKKKAPSAFVLRLVKNIVSRVVAHKFDLKGRLGISDAGATAYAVGLLGIVYTQICSFLCYERVGDCGVAPDYDAETINLQFDGIFSVSLADIIIAAIVTVMPTAKPRAARKRSNYGYDIAE